MGLPAAVVALALAAFLALRPHSCKGFISSSLRLGPRLGWIGLRPGTTVFQPVSLLANMVNECLHIDSGDAVDEPGRGQDAQRKACKLLWDPPEYHTLIVFVVNADPSCCKLFMFVA